MRIKPLLPNHSTTVTIQTLKHENMVTSDCLAIHGKNIYVDVGSLSNRNEYCILNLQFTRTREFRVSLTFSGPTSVTHISPHHCQFGGLFMSSSIPGYHMDMCDDRDSYVSYITSSMIYLRVIWYSGYSSGHLEMSIMPFMRCSMYVMDSEVYNLDLRDTFNNACHQVICPPPPPLLDMSGLVVICPPYPHQLLELPRLR